MKLSCALIMNGLNRSSRFMFLWNVKTFDSFFQCSRTSGVLALHAWLVDRSPRLAPSAIAARGQEAGARRAALRVHQLVEEAWMRRGACCFAAVSAAKVSAQAPGSLQGRPRSSGG